MTKKVSIKVKEKEILQEKEKLVEIFRNLDDEKKFLTAGLIENAARMRVMLKYYAEDILQNGNVENFSQSVNLDAYDRERPVVRQYNSTLANYSKIIKQLSDLLPSGEKEVDDGFDVFLHQGGKSS